MHLDTAAGGKAGVPLPLQFVNIEITPLLGGQFAVAMQATLLDEEELQFVGQDLANERVDTIEQALAVIHANAAVLVNAS